MTKEEAQKDLDLLFDHYFVYNGNYYSFAGDKQDYNRFKFLIESLVKTVFNQHQ